jgi:hypothetical protein
MAQTQPQFKPGDRFWTHYDYKWGTVISINHTVRDAVHGVTGDKLPDTTWYDVRYDDGSTSLLDDAHGNWDMARLVPPHIAKRFNYGDDPLANATVTEAQMLQAAADFLEADNFDDNSEYVRALCELIADCFGRPHIRLDQRKEWVERDLKALIAKRYGDGGDPRVAA